MRRQLANTTTDRWSDAAETNNAARRERGEVISVLREQRLYPVYQPIVDCSTGSTVGFEALARFPGESGRPPNLWFDQARRVGFGVELELAAVRLAIAHAAKLPVDTFLAVNCSAALIAAPELPQVLAATTRALVIELTEHDPVADYDALKRALARIRHNARLAIDDAGAGFSSLTHILRLSPDYIKLDTSLTRGIDTDPVRRSLAKALVAFAQETAAALIVEGVESRAEEETLRALGIRLAQGNYFARPARADVHRPNRLVSVTPLRPARLSSSSPGQQ
jgi:EAL domain-containing protein (putative c-di-GMP-specific phosphodiesterase class I)